MAVLPEPRENPGAGEVVNRGANLLTDPAGRAA